MLRPKLAVFLVLLAALACGDEEEKPSGEDDPAEVPTVSSPATKEGLASLFRSLTEDLRAGNDDRVREKLLALALPAPEEFFSAHFPNDIAARLASSYSEKAEHLGEIGDVVRTQLDKGHTQVLAEKFDQQEDANAVGYQNLALKQMSEVTPLYSVRLVSKGEDTGFHIWSFAHDGRQFRWVGKLKEVKPGLSEDKQRILELRLRDSRKLQR